MSHNIIDTDNADKATLDALQAGEGQSGVDVWTLMEELISFAAEAEQQMAFQKQRIRELESLTETDELTGLKNRRGFRNEMRKAISRANRHGEVSTLMFLDIDNFKAVNDTAGHEGGDHILASVGRVIRRNIRTSDSAARLGGDEFALLLSGSTPDGAKARIRDIREQIQALSPSTVTKLSGISVSAGMAEIHPGTRLDKIMRLADQRMYQEKRTRH